MRKSVRLGIKTFPFPNAGTVVISNLTEEDAQKLIETVEQLRVLLMLAGKGDFASKLVAEFRNT